MALPVFDKKESIPAGFEDEYEEKEGKWHPIDHTSKLHDALETERAERKKAEGLARKAAKDAADAEAKRNAAAAGMTEEQLKKIYDSIESNLRGEYEPKIAELEKYRTEIRALKLDSKVKTLFKDGGARDGNINDFWKLHADEFDLTADGKPMVKNEPGKDVARHVQSILKTRQEWVVGTKATGGRTNQLPTSTPSSGLNPGGVTFEDLVKNPSSAIAVANEV
jgi:hypothetical protein